MSFIEDLEVFQKEYPSFAAVNRAANGWFMLLNVHI